MLQRLNRHASTRATAAAVALFTSVSLVFGQTKIVAPENKYKVKEDVQAGREAAREVEQQLPILRDDGVDDYVERIGQRLAQSHSRGIPPSRIPLLVRRRQRERSQRVRAAGRPDVHQPRHARSGEERRRSRRRARARDQPRGATSWHGAGWQGHTVSGGLDPRADSGRDYRRRRRSGDFARVAVRVRNRISKIWPRIRTAGGSARRANHGARGLRPARHGQHVPDDPGERRQRRTRSG